MPISEVYNEDCMIGMARYPDKFFELAIVDPPYGIGRDGYECGSKPSEAWRAPTKKVYTKKDWDSAVPDREYFDELRRVSKNQIIWGGNYFIEHLRSSMGMIGWDKKVNGNFSEFELAWTSFDSRARLFEWMWNGYRKQQPEERTHPTQKPVKLYEWLLKEYANEGDKILDTHLGSGSSRIAAYKLGFDFYGWEIDKEYYEAQEARFKKAIAEPLFDSVKQPIQGHWFD